MGQAIPFVFPTSLVTRIIIAVHFIELRNECALLLLLTLSLRLTPGGQRRPYAPHHARPRTHTPNAWFVLRRALACLHSVSGHGREILGTEPHTVDAHRDPGDKSSMCARCGREGRRRRSVHDPDTLRFPRHFS
jgi:hypothetical protein